MITREQRDQYSDLLNELSLNLDITETEYNDIVRSYNAMGEWLSDDNSPLKMYAPKIQPQGSFMLGTMIRPVSESGDIDIDLVCKLAKKPYSWTQKCLKNSIGDRIKSHGRYSHMLDREGKRCWTLKYADEKYHMDVLPCFVSDDYQTLYESAFSNIELGDVSKLAIRITDNTRADYNTDVNVDNWLKSNPFGYAKWFYSIANKVRGNQQFRSLKESIEAVPKNKKQKLPLQVAIQLLKRHRDIMFEGQDKKPISIIITTLAARAYQGEDNIYDALHNIINRMKGLVELRGDSKWVANPVNIEENFADRWAIDPQRERNFYQWLDKIARDFYLLTSAHGNGLPKLEIPMANMFGSSIAKKTFVSYATRKKSETDNGLLKMAATTGMLGATGAKAVAKHNFYGGEEK